MPEPLDLNSANLGSEGSPAWNLEIFRRAFCGRRSDGKFAVFDDVVHRLNAGFSVLVYCPGACMSAAGAYLCSRNKEWKEYGKHFKEAVTINDIWEKEASGTFGSLMGWLTSTTTRAPQAIYHNLDLMSDGHGGLYHDNSALTAIFSLIESTRNGVVCGLADRDSGKLPGMIEKSFTDIVTIKQIDLEGFRQIIPVQVIDRLNCETDLPDHIVRDLAARLRWSDPIRAVKIMREASAKCEGKPEELMRCISMQTRPVGYEVLEATDKEEAGRLAGFDGETLKLIETQVIHPWKQKPSFKRRHTGLIMHGPAGTGKTTLARWIARNIGLPITVASASEIKDPLYGNAERNMHALFRDARRASPCVLVLDDADDLFPARDQIKGSVAGADTGVVNAALQELDGFNGPLEDVLLILTTNRLSALDGAFSQRIGLHILVPYPLHGPQVERIVNTIGEECELDISAVRGQLVSHFMDWVGLRDSAVDILGCRGQPGAAFFSACDFQSNAAAARQPGDSGREIPRHAAGCQQYAAVFQIVRRRPMKRRRISGRVKEFAIVVCRTGIECCADWRNTGQKQRSVHVIRYSSTSASGYSSPGGAAARGCRAGAWRTGLPGDAENS
jgi:hypothetical protein